MKTFTEVDGQWFPGTLMQEHRVHPSTGRSGIHSYLSADLGVGWIHVEKWDFEEPRVSESDLREALTAAIRKKRDVQHLTRH